jgi:hypothetical protein
MKTTIQALKTARLLQLMITEKERGFGSPYWKYQPGARSVKASRAAGTWSQPGGRRNPRDYY